MKKVLPFVLLVVFVICPVLMLGVAGFNLLRHERERWDRVAADARVREARWVADELREGLEVLHGEMQTLLRTLPAGDPEAALLALQDGHPLVRNIFWVNPQGDRVLPPPALQVDPETERFLVRYAALFDGRVPWTSPDAEEAPRMPMRQTAMREAVRTLGRSADGAYALPAAGLDADSVWGASLVWRDWRWEDGHTLLAYLPGPRGDIRGLELEMSALYARLDVLLRLLGEAGQVLVLLDRADEPLLATGELPETEPVTVEMGPLLPFARLAMFPRAASLPAPGRELYLLAVGFGLVLLLSISGAGLGLTAWLNRSRREARRKTTFVSNVSHEFKTPLTTLRLYTDLLLENRISDPEKQRRYLQTMRDESDRLARLVHNVLDFSRLEMKRKALAPERVDVSVLLEKVTGAMAERFEAAKMRVQLPEGPLLARVDPDAAEQILLNLCENALQYAASGGVLAVDVVSDADMMHLVFRDRGPGIAKPARRHLFQPFHQADDRLTRERGGTGLGLHIARRLARESGGDLLYREVETGACFVWKLPKDEESA